MPQNSFSKWLFVNILTIKSSSGGSDFVVFADWRRKKKFGKKNFSLDQLTLDKNPRVRFFVFMFWWNAREDLSLGATMLSNFFFPKHGIFLANFRFCPAGDKKWPQILKKILNWAQFFYETSQISCSLKIIIIGALLLLWCQQIWFFLTIFWKIDDFFTRIVTVAPQTFLVKNFFFLAITHSDLFFW